MVCLICRTVIGECMCALVYLNIVVEMLYKEIQLPRNVHVF
jgi:hypothetical protein